MFRFLQTSARPEELRRAKRPARVGWLWTAVEILHLRLSLVGSIAEGG